MTKRDIQAAEYAAETCETFGITDAVLRARFREEMKLMREARRDTFGIRVHRAVSKWLRVVWLKFLGR